jgi:uncharacterized membrane protein YccC
MLRNLDFLLRHYGWFAFAPFFGVLIVLAVGKAVWPEIPMTSLGYGFAGMVVGAAMVIVAFRVLRKYLHPWVLRKLNEHKDGIA